MYTVRSASWILAAGALLVWSASALAEEKLEQPIVMQRGPVHEAFAQPSNARPEAAQTVPKQPPAPIRELPPDQKPKGENVVWIPGYWAWDMEKKDFLWVSGTWRVAPPERKWVPGYWHEADDGHQWVSGFWASQKKNELTYVDSPPASLETGANTPAPDGDSSWVPGMWMWRDGAWVWRPGFWNSNYAGWIYNPPSYYWTPYGLVYNGGYWDYTLEDRGLLFAPVCFGGPFSGIYTPDCVVGIGGLWGNLWFGPGCYWFGNCFGPFWRGCGFSPWCFHGARTGDALWAHQAWVNRGNPNWAANARGNFIAVQNGKVAGPATTFNALGHATVATNTGANGVGNGHVGGNNLVTPLNQLSNRSSLTRTSTQQLAQAQSSANQLRQASFARSWGEGNQAVLHGAGGGNTFRMPSQLVTNTGNMNSAHQLAQGNANTGTNMAHLNAGSSYGPRVSSFSSAGRGMSSGGYHGGGGGGGHAGGGGHGGGHR